VGATNTATFAPTVPLLPQTQYTATIATSAQSAAGTALAANYAFSFTTGNIADATPTTIRSTNPASGATAVPTNQIITATGELTFRSVLLDSNPSDNIPSMRRMR
jgi:hypothetical protein